MPHVKENQLLALARRGRYGVLSLAAADMQMTLGLIRAAEEKRAPVIIVYNEDITPDIPMDMAIPFLVRAAERASVPVATNLDHGRSLDHAARAIRLGVASVMYDGSALPYDENVAATRAVVRMAHAAGVDVEAELGSIPGAESKTGPNGEKDAYTDPDTAADFVEKTGADVLAVSVGNAHGVYRGEPKIDLERIRQIYAKVSVPLTMHGASGLDEALYPEIVEAGISKVCYHTAMARKAADDIRRMLDECGEDGAVYQELISRAQAFFHAEGMRLMDMVGSSGNG